jgi:tetratricopeptide (TPR) repeat protein
MFGIAGVFFGVLVGWIIGTQQAPPARPAPAADAPAAQSRQQAPPLDESRAAALKASADSNPRDVATRVQLGNLYFDHDRFAEAARWYEDALKIDQRNVNVSTDLGIAYYYMNQPDAALKQFDQSLAIEPGHTKTLLNVGVVKAFAKQDLDGAAKAWQRVVDLAPGSPEAERARQALATIRGSHPDVGGGGRESRPQDKPE